MKGVRSGLNVWCVYLCVCVYLIRVNDIVICSPRSWEAQRNLIGLSFVTFIIIAGLSKLTDLQRGCENTAGNKYQTVYKY